MRTQALAVMGGFLLGAGALWSQPAQAVAIGGPADHFTFVAGGMIGGPAVKNAPYSAQASTQTTQMLADGNRIVQNSSAKIYRDSDGRQRREQTISSIGPFPADGGDPVQIVFISDPVAGVQYSLNSKEHTAVKLPAPPPVPMPGAAAAQPLGVFVQRAQLATGDIPAPPPPPPAPLIEGGAMITAPVPGPGAVAGAASATAISGPNVMYIQKSLLNGKLNPPATDQLGSKVIGGVNATGTRSTITIPAGQIGNDKDIVITDETWYSPELQVMVESTHTDPRMGTTVYSLTNISRGEPPADLFQVPADYTIKDGSAGLQIMTRPAPAQ